jgi:acyl transferase family protein/beta-ketoacyl synthase-like protein
VTVSAARNRPAAATIQGSLAASVTVHGLTAVGPQSVLLPLHPDAMHGNGVLVGIKLSAFAADNLIMVPISGCPADRFGRKRVAGLAFAAMATPMLGTAGTALVVFAAAIPNGAKAGMFNPANGAAAATSVVVGSVRRFGWPPRKPQPVADDGRGQGDPMTAITENFKSFSTCQRAISPIGRKGVACPGHFPIITTTTDEQNMERCTESGTGRSPVRSGAELPPNFLPTGTKGFHTMSDSRSDPDRAEPISIVGVACRLAERIESPAEFWGLLRRGGDVVTEVPVDQLAEHVTSLPASSPTSPPASSPTASSPTTSSPTTSSPTTSSQSVATLRRVDGEPTTADVIHLLFAMQVALAGAWRRHGAEPAAVICHSADETAAVIVAGALDPHDEARLVCRRSMLLRWVVGQSATAQVQLTFDEVTARLPGGTDMSPVAPESPLWTDLRSIVDSLHDLRIEVAPVTGTPRRFWLDADNSGGTPTCKHDVDCHTSPGGCTTAVGPTSLWLWQIYLDDSSPPCSGNNPVHVAEMVPAMVLLTASFEPARNTVDRTALREVNLLLPISLLAPREVHTSLHEIALRLFPQLATSTDEDGAAKVDDREVEPQEPSASADPRRNGRVPSAVRPGLGACGPPSVARRRTRRWGSSRPTRHRAANRSERRPNAPRRCGPWPNASEAG